jgi:acrylyl-CoA reductase (NADPH)
MNKNTFRAVVIEKDRTGAFSQGIKQKKIVDLPVNDLLIKVSYSSLNYKDALSFSGNRGVSKNYPHTPGIDAVGIVKNSSVSQFNVGDKVIVSGYDLGMNTAGGFGEYIRVPKEWVCHLPTGLQSLESMIIGTAGLTAGLCIEMIIRKNDISGKKVVVSGATGGVGTIAIKLLNMMGADVTAITSSIESKEYLMMIGANEVISVNELLDSTKKPLSKSIWSFAIDVAGGSILSALIVSMKYGGVVACCGNVSNPNFDTNVYPFILRANQLVGIDSAETSIDKKSKIWKLFGSDWKLKNLESLHKIVLIDELFYEIEKMLKGEQIGRIVLKHGKSR